MRNLSLASLLVLACGAVHSIAADGAPKTLSIHQLPLAVQETIKTEVGDDKLGQIEKDEEDGVVSYTATKTTKDGERSFSVRVDGTLLSQEVTLAETPPSVQGTIKAQLGDATLESIERVFEGADISFDVEITRKDGTERFFSVAADGKLTCLQITLEEVPAAARRTIEAHLGKGALGDLYRLIEGTEVSYDAEVNQDGKVRDVIVSSGGKLESIQVFLSEVPPAAQATIKEKIGDGKIIRIDQSYTPRGAVLTYEVEGRKDGKPFNFSVGPKGRFLGVDK